jgi:hypothetical protein
MRYNVLESSYLSDTLYSAVSVFVASVFWRFLRYKEGALLIGYGPTGAVSLRETLEDSGSDHWHGSCKA